MSLTVVQAGLPTALLVGVLGGIVGLAPGFALARSIVTPLKALTRAVDKAAAIGAWSDITLPERSSATEIDALRTALGRLASQAPADGLTPAQRHDPFATVLTTMLDGVVLLNESGRPSFFNPAARRLLANDDQRDADAEDAPTDWCRHEQIAAAAERALHGERVDETIELANARTFRLHAAPLDGPGSGAVLVLHDLTEMRRLDRVRQEFVANASHELLTPIATVRALADSLARGGLDDRKVARRFLKQLRVEADRLTALARDLVDLAQAQADELRLELKPTDVNEVVVIVLERLHARAAKANVSLDALWETQTPPVLADATRLEQVLLNLVQNAIKFTPAGGRVEISTETRDDDVIIRVKDTGIGIAPNDLPRIFERFYKVRGVRGAAGGTGLGLAIVRHLVGAMHGEVQAASEIGGGSTFTVTLRRAEQGPTNLEMSPD